MKRRLSDRGLTCAYILMTVSILVLTGRGKVATFLLFSLTGKEEAD